MRQKSSGGRGFGAAVDDEIIRIRAHLGEVQAEAATLEAGIKRITAEVDARRATRNEIDQKIARFGMFTEEFSRRFDAITVEKQTIDAAVARQQEETRNGAAELTALEASLDKTTETINEITARIDEIKKRLDDTNIPVLTDQIEKKRKEIEEAERRLQKQGRGYQRCPAGTAALQRPACGAGRRPQTSGRTQPADRYRDCRIKRTDSSPQITDCSPRGAAEGIFGRA